MPASPSYEIWANAPPEQVEAVALDLFREWLAFAEGEASIGGYKLVHPTGFYASSIRVEANPQLRLISFIADEQVAPEALWLEVGHRSVDLKQHLQQGRAYPIHRGAPESGSRSGPGSSLHPGQFLVAWRTIGDTGWVIPAMPAYAPGLHLAQEAARKLGGRMTRR